MKTTKVVASVIGILFLIGFILLVSGQVEIGAAFVTAAVGVAILIFPFVLFSNLLSVSHKKRVARENDPEYQARLAESKKLEEDRRTIVEVKMLVGGSVKEHKYGMKGAAVGGLVGGFRGAIVGAVIPNGKQTQKQRFAVKYRDGHVEIKEYTPGSYGYNTLMAYVKWEDIQ